MIFKNERFVNAGCGGKSDRLRPPAFGTAPLGVALLLCLLSLGCAAPARPEPSDPGRAEAIGSTEVRPCGDDGVCRVRTGLGYFLTAATPFDEGRFYTAHLDGTVALFDERAGESRIVVQGLSMPQGLVVADGRLYASHLGNYCRELAASEHLLTEVNPATCTFKARHLVDGVAAEDALADLARRTSGEIVSMAISPETGELTDYRVELDDLPVQGRDHSPNGLAFAGGWVYASIGHPFNDPTGPGLRDNPDRHHFDLSALRRPDTAGTVIRFRPGAAGEYEVFATGLRNVYGISVDERGNVYGADNDSSAPGPSKALEEVNIIRQGAHYGYPEHGTNTAPPEAGVTEPVAVLDGKGSTHVHAGEDALYVAYGTGGGDGFVVDRFRYDTWERSRYLRKSDHYITSIHERRGRLYLFGLIGSLHVLDPSHPGPIDSPLHGVRP